jgi:hypothetical protein
MKRKIILLALVLVFIPSVLFGASQFTKNEEVTYYANTVTVNDVTINDTISLNGTVYIKARSLSSQLNKSFDTDKDGNITITNKMRPAGFLNSKWGDNPEAIIKTYGKPDSNSNNMISYLSDFQYGKECATGFYFENNLLTKAFHSFIPTRDKCVDEYESLVRKLYDEFDTIVFKSAYLPQNCPTDSSWEDAMKNYGAYLYTKLANDTETAFITLKYKTSYGYYNITIDYEPK